MNITKFLIMSAFLFKNRIVSYGIRNNLVYKYVGLVVCVQVPLLNTIPREMEPFCSSLAVLATVSSYLRDADLISSSRKVNCSSALSIRFSSPALS
jgi:hypothetical protein